MPNLVIPYDIWETIVDIIAYIPCPQDPPEGRLGRLATCALVCKDFSKLCRPRIFEHISGIEAAFEHFEGNRFQKLANSLSSSPALVNHIRTLTFALPDIMDYGDSTANDFTREETDHIITIFANIPHLEMISIHASEGSMTTGHAEKFQSILVKAHLQRATLHTLRLHHLPDIQVTDITSSPSLKSLSWQDCSFVGSLSLTAACPSAISHLHLVTDSPDTPLMLLDYFSSLTHLEIAYAQSSWMEHDLFHDMIPNRPFLSNSMFDPSKLKHFQVDFVPLFFKFCADRRVRDDVPLFASLEVFNQWDGRGDELYVVRNIIKETRSLRSLTLADSPENSSEEYPFEIYDLSARFTDGTLCNLTDLHLIVHESPYSEYYTATLEGLISLFTSMAHLNALERIELSFNVDEVPPEGSVFDTQRPYEDLRPIADSLAHVEAYPALKEVKIEMCIWLRPDFSNGGEEDFTSTGIDGLQNLRCRPGVVVQDTLVIRRCR